MITNNGFIVILFLAIATLLSMGYGWTVKEEKLPFQSVMNFSKIQWNFIRIWVKIALVLGVILPSIFLIKFWHQSLARQFWEIYS